MKNTITTQSKASIISSTPINWGELKLKFYISPENTARAFLKNQKLPLKMKDKNKFSGWVDEKIKGWESDRADYREKLMQRVKNEYADSKIMQIHKFLEDEKEITEKLFKATKSKLENSIVELTMDKGNTELKIKLTIKELKQLSETVSNLVKIGRQRLGLPFGKEEEVVDRSINQFNFDLINLDDKNGEHIMKFFDKKQGKNKIFQKF